MSKTMTLKKKEMEELRAEIAREMLRLRRMAGTAQADSARVELERAMQRIEQGEYGQCVSCSQPIPFDRLIVMPATEHCVGCGR